ncbi:tail fiber assembly protein, partial [Escherichia coli]|nr:tail fiber assembly protein [Escherichia coli]
GTADRNRSHWSTSKTPSYTKSVSWQHHPPYDKWDGEKWVTDTEAQHSAVVDAAEAQRQSLIDTAMASISLIQLKLQAGRNLTQAETARLNAALDYIDAVTATDTSTAPDVIWPELPEA